MGRTQRHRLRQKKEAAKCVAPQKDISAIYRYLRSRKWSNGTALSVRHFPGTGRGLCSKSHKFRQGEALIELPLECLITIATLDGVDSFKAHFRLAESFPQEERISFQSLLALFLLNQQHQQKASPWAAYIDTLPDHFTMPYFCTINELQCLPEEILDRTMAQNRKLRANFQKIPALLTKEPCTCCGKPLNEIYTLAAFKWAYFVVHTRSVFVNSALLQREPGPLAAVLHGGTNMALAPFLDLFNHADHVVTTAELIFSNAQQPLGDADAAAAGIDGAVGNVNDGGGGVFVLRLTEVEGGTVEPYSQLFISYGPMTNFSLLLEYGFCPASNRHNYFVFKLSDIEHFVQSDAECRDNAAIHIGNKFKFIRDHNLADGMFVHQRDGISHNLRVVLHLLLRVPVDFASVLSRVAFGEIDELHDAEAEVQRLCAFKIGEYKRSRETLDALALIEPLSESGLVVVAFLGDAIRYLETFMSGRQIGQAGSS